jgi:hypothetical protein
MTEHQYKKTNSIDCNGRALLRRLQQMVPFPRPNSLQKCEFLVVALLAIQLAIVGVINSYNEKQIALSANVIGSIREEFMGGDDGQRQGNGTILKLPTPLFDMNFTSDSSNLWEDSSVLPQWMKDYFAWHRYQRSKITPENWKQYRYCIMRCLDIDPRCGGAADRIKTVPVVLYWAARTKRIFMIHWSRPTFLEAFLLPPEGGVDWRVPDWMVQKDIFFQNKPEINVARFQGFFFNNSKQVVLTTKLQSYNGGSMFYNDNVEGPRFETIFHDMWRTMFTPTLPIQNIIQQHLDRSNLRPGEYTAAHVRGRYGKIVWPDQLLYMVTENSINCASNLRPDGPIFFASDSKQVVDHVMGKLVPKKSTKIVALQRDYEPLHLDKAKGWRSRHASEYYDIFVDLYLIALARCVSYNIGGFGEWGLWMSRNSSCFIQHGKLKNPVRPCSWVGVATPEYSKPANDEPTFLPPMAVVKRVH